MPDLTTIYTEIYELNFRASPRDKINAQNCYRMVLCSGMPLRSSILANAIALNADGSFNSFVNESYIQAICSNLLVLDGEGCVQFAHLSVVEFLKSDTFGGFYACTNNNAYAAEQCLTLISCRNCRLPVIEDDLASSLTEYAILYWPYHCKLAKAAKRNTGELYRLLHQFLSMEETSTSFQKWLGSVAITAEDWPRRSWPRELHAIHTRPADPLLTICAWGFAEMIDKPQSALGICRSAVQARNHLGQSALIVASRFGHVSVATALLEYQVDLEIKDLCGRTALALAVCNHHPDVVEFLINKGAIIDTKDNLEATALQRAIMSHDETMVRLLCEREADVRQHRTSHSS